MTTVGVRLVLATLVIFFTLAAANAFADDLTKGHMVPLGDQAIADASAKAQANVDQFLAKMFNPPAGTSGFSVKIGIVDQGSGFALTKDTSVNAVEFFWILKIVPSGDGFTGVLADTPETVKNISAGQSLRFKKSDIFDWMYFDNGKMVGNFTACPVLKAGPIEDLKSFEQQTGMVCE